MSRFLFISLLFFISFGVWNRAWYTFRYHFKINSKNHQLKAETLKQNKLSISLQSNSAIRRSVIFLGSIKTNQNCKVKNHKLCKFIIIQFEEFLSVFTVYLLRAFKNGYVQAPNGECNKSRYSTPIFKIYLPWLWDIFPKCGISSRTRFNFARRYKDRLDQNIQFSKSLNWRNIARGLWVITYDRNMAKR